MIKITAISILFISISLSAQANLKEAWGSYSFPSIMGKDLEDNFEKLPLSGRAMGEEKYWSGDYWANVKGNINNRWNAPGAPGFNLRSPSKNEALKMSMDELARLSPSEKYDLYAGRYEYPLKNEVSEKFADPTSDEWEGICHGWAPATINHNEPTPKVVTNPDGIQIPFGSSDIKALLSYYYANVFKVADTHQMGRRCSQRGIFVFSRDCRKDLNAGAFHIVLANKIGIQKAAFLADMDPKKEVWNHPVYAFKSTVIERNLRPVYSSARGTERRVRVQTVINYVDEGPNFWTPVLGTNAQRVESKTFDYYLELTPFGDIIGGEWKSSERPDFIWTKEKALIWVGLFDRLPELLND